MKKRMLSLLLASAMAIPFAVNASAEGADPADWPVIRVEVVSQTGEEARELEVEAALNDYLVSIDAGVQADLIPLAFGDRATQLTLLLTDPKNGVDLFCWRFYSSVSDMVNNDQIISLEPYREVYPELWELFPESVYKTCQVNGEQYSMPGADSFGNFQVYSMRKDIAEELGIADRHGDYLTREEYSEILAMAEAAHPELGWQPDPRVIPFQGIDNLGMDAWLGVLREQGVGQEEIVNYYASEEFKNYCYMCKEWADNGYFIDDPLNNEALHASLLNDGLTGGGMFEAYSVDYALSLMNAQIKNYETIIFQLTDFVGNNSCVYNGWNISSICPEPDAAMKLLYLMYTDPVVCRYFTLGIEGVTYVLDDNGCAWYPEGVTAETVGWNLDCPWFYPNECLSAPFATDMSTYFTDMIACWTNPDNQYSNAMGFVFDNSSVYDQYTACSAIVDEYKDALMYGQVSDVDEAIAELNEELEENGINEILEEMQKQFNTFLGK